MIVTEVLLVSILLATVMLLTIFRRRLLPIENFTSVIAYKKPTLWWFVDAETNSRNWWDFGARSSVEPNRGYLQLALDAVKRTQGRDFTIVALVGRDAVMNHVPNAPHAAKQLPPALWRAWAISNLLANNGGLAMDGNSTLCIGPSIYPYVETKESGIFDGANTPGLVDPSPYIGWSKQAHNNAWRYSASVWNTLVNAGPQTWSASIARNTPHYVFQKQVEQGLSVIKIQDGGKLPNGKPRELDDLFGRVGNPANPKTAIDDHVLFIPYDGEALERRYEFNWVLKLSRAELLDSDIVWTQLL